MWRIGESRQARRCRDVVLDSKAEAASSSSGTPDQKSTRSEKRSHTRDLAGRNFSGAARCRRRAVRTALVFSGARRALCGLPYDDRGDHGDTLADVIGTSLAAGRGRSRSRARFARSTASRGRGTSSRLSHAITVTTPPA